MKMKTRQLNLGMMAAAFTLSAVMAASAPVSALAAETPESEGRLSEN